MFSAPAELVAPPADAVARRSLASAATKAIGAMLGFSVARDVRERLPSLLWSGDGATEAATPSGINADGTPMQIVLSGDAGGWRVRVLFDPGTDAADARQRYRFARRSAYRLLGSRHTGARGLRNLLSRFGPDAGTDADRFTEGVLWLAFAPGSRGLALYIDASVREPDEQWTRTAHFLRDHVNGDLASPMLDAWRATGLLAPASVGAEIGVQGMRRFKAHWRLVREPRDGELAAIAPVLAVPHVRRGLRSLVGERTLEAGGVLLETCFVAGCASSGDAKLDIPAASLAPDAVRAANECADALGVRALPDSATALVAASRLSYAGVGCDADGRSRLNLYLHPIPSGT